MPERTFKRRFTEATGFAPLTYIQQLRVADAKRRLERTREPFPVSSFRIMTLQVTGGPFSGFISVKAP